MEQILKGAGAERVSDKAKAELKLVVEVTAKDIAERAVRLASHAGRKTIKGSDIRLAANS